MPRTPLRVQHRPEKLLSDDKRVIPRFLNLRRAGRVRSVIQRLLRVEPARIPALLREVRSRFGGRHRDLEAALREHYERAAGQVRGLGEPGDAQKLLIGAYFTLEYSIESAALFNPSIVPHPDQSDLPAGTVRFLMSLRATGEGHISSIVFRKGVIDRSGAIAWGRPPRYAHRAKPVPDARLDKNAFVSKLRQELGDLAPVRPALEALPEAFTRSELREAIARLQEARNRSGSTPRLAALLRWIGEAHYELRFPDDCLPSETVIFPATRYESMGMEDLRLVRFLDEDGQATYYGTYTAWDGLRMTPMLLETRDFRRFHISPLVGRYAKNKGMALFPRTVNGTYLMLSRHDGENLYLLRSQDVHTWNVSQKLLGPRADWELLQVGNCGSPLATEAGWIVLTHGVGPMRRYCIGAILLDRANPSKVIGRLRRPLLVPADEDREGYVPNVVYSCGSLVHGGRLVIPYAVADARTRFATIGVGALARRLRQEGP